MIATMSACLCEVTLPGEAEVIAAGGRARVFIEGVEGSKVKVSAFAFRGCTKL